VNGTAPTQDEAVRVAVGRYAADVRRHLADLPPDQVDDLTDGLEADLTDALSDGPAGAVEGSAVDLTSRFGDPHGYAQELRAAAGLPDEGTTGARPWPDRWSRAGGSVAAGWRRTAAVVRRQPWAAPVAGAARDLRPFWWAARGWIAYQALMWVASESSVLLMRVRPERDGVPGRALHWTLLLLLVAVSVQWGRGRWGAAQLPWLSRAATAGALVLLVPVAVFTYESRFYAPAASDVRYVEIPGATIQPDDGVWVDGMQVSNLFVYDADGNPLSEVQVYDDRGRPVRATADEGYGSWSLPGVDEPWTFVPSQDEDGRRRWNVYPLQGAPTSSFSFAGDGSAPRLDEAPRTPPRPFAKAPALVLSAADGTGASPDEGPGSGGGETPGTGPTAAP
jgi:hypothetical protein